MKLPALLGTVRARTARSVRACLARAAASARATSAAARTALSRDPRPNGRRLAAASILLVGVTFVIFAVASLAASEPSEPRPTPTQPSSTATPSPTVEPSPTAEPEVELIPVTLPSGVSLPVPKTWKTSTAAGADLAFVLPSAPETQPAKPADRITEPPAPTPAPVVTVTDLGPLASVYDQDILDLVGEALSVSGREAPAPVVDDRGVATFTQTGTFTVEASVLVYAGRGLLVTLTLAKLDPVASSEVAGWVTALTEL